MGVNWSRQCVHFSNFKVGTSIKIVTSGGTNLHGKFTAWNSAVHEIFSKIGQWMFSCDHPSRDNHNTHCIRRS